jgi:WD40 repeat protein
LWKYFYLDVEEVDANRELIYFTPKLDAEADGFFDSYYFGTGNAIFQFNLKTGEFIPILPMEADYRYNDIGLSADSEILAVSSNDHPNEFHLMHLVDGQTYQTITLNEDISITGAFKFSEDNKYLIYAAGYKGWREVKNGISIYRLDLQTMENIELVSNDERLMLPRHFSYSYTSYFSGDTVSLVSVHFMDAYNPYEWYQWELNILTGKVTEISATDGW